MQHHWATFESPGPQREWFCPHCGDKTTEPEKTEGCPGVKRGDLEKKAKELEAKKEEITLQLEEIYSRLTQLRDQRS